MSFLSHTSGIAGGIGSARLGGMRKEFAIAIAVGLIIVVVWAAAFFAFALFHP